MAQAPAVVKMVLNRNFVLATTLGHTIRFIKDKPVSVPKICARAAAEIGALPVDGTPAVEIEDKVDTAPVDPTERRSRIREAIELLMERNDREDFTAAGKPSVSALTGLLGFRPDAREISAEWQQIQEAKAE